MNEKRALAVKQQRSLTRMRWVALATLLAFTLATAAERPGREERFKKMRFQHTVTLDLPAGWTQVPLTPQGAAPSKLSKLSDLVAPKGLRVPRVTPLLHVRARGSERYAMLGLLTQDDDDVLSQQETEALTPAELRDADTPARQRIELAVSIASSKLVQWYPLERRTVNGAHALVTRYVRSPLQLPGERVYVEVYNFSFRHRMLLLTF